MGFEGLVMAACVSAIVGCLSSLFVLVCEMTDYRQMRMLVWPGEKMYE